MPHARALRGLAAFVATLIIVAACSSDVLAPPDGVACTRGTISAGATKYGEIKDQSCLLWSDWDYTDNRAESWTLDAKANSAYVIRLTAIDDGGDTTEFDGSLSLYARNRTGDPALAGVWHDYVNGNEHTRELVFVTDRDREVSIRVDAHYETDFGAYRLEIQRCATRAITDGQQSPELETADGCEVSGFLGGMADVRFLTYRVSSERQPDISITRTSGTTPIRAAVGGMDLDIWGYLGSGVYIYQPSSNGPIALSPELVLPGTYTIAVGVESGEPARVRVNISEPALRAAIK